MLNETSTEVVAWKFRLEVGRALGRLLLALLWATSAVADEPPIRWKDLPCGHYEVRSDLVRIELISGFGPRAQKGQ
jgi:hypothetical protein